MCEYGPPLTHIGDTGNCSFPNLKTTIDIVPICEGSLDDRNKKMLYLRMMCKKLRRLKSTLNILSFSFWHLLHIHLPLLSPLLLLFEKSEWEGANESFMLIALFFLSANYFN